MYIKNKNKKIRKFKMKIKLIDYLIFVLVMILAVFIKENFFSEFKPSLYDISKFEINLDNFNNIKTISKEAELDFSELLVYYCLENNFFHKTDEIKTYEELKKILFENYENLKLKYEDEKYDKYKNLISYIIEDIRTPIDEENSEKIFSVNSYNKNKIYNFGKSKGIYIFSEDSELNKIQVKSVFEGIVSEIGKNKKYGNYVIIKNNDREILYGFLNNINSGLAIGNKILENDFIGYMGNNSKKEIVRLYLEYKIYFDGSYIFFNIYPFLDWYMI